MGIGRRLWRNRRLALLDTGDDRSGVLAGCLRGERGIPAQRYALRPAERPGLDDEDLLAGGIDSDAETGKIAVPEDGILAIDGQAVQDAFGESAVLSLAPWCGAPARRIRRVSIRFGPVSVWVAPGGHKWGLDAAV